MSRMEVLETTELIPAPWKSEAEIVALVREARSEIERLGGVVIRERRLHNVAFDERGERTTTELVVDWSRR